MDLLIDANGILRSKEITLCNDITDPFTYGKFITTLILMMKLITFLWCMI